MANINHDDGGWGMARRLLRYLVEGLIHVGSAWIALPPPLPPNRGTRDEHSHEVLARDEIEEVPRLPVGHPERLLPHVAPAGAERLLWRQLEDGPR